MRFLLLVLLAASALTGCDEAAFDPFEESDAAFSLFGYADVAADTQFIRVATLRASAYAEEPVEAVGTLEHLETGRVAVLRDSLFRFSSGALVHNFWTAEPVEAAAAYRLTATRPDGAAASATFETPAPFPDPALESGLSPYSSPAFPPRAQSMTFFGIEKLADLRVTYVLEAPDLTVTVSYLDRLFRTPEGRFALGFNAYADVQRALGGAEGAACPGLRSARVFVAATTAEWPDLLDFDAETLALPSTFSNVAGGLGYVGGVMTRSGEWEAMRVVFALHQAGCAD